jgi:hypothetical protein
MLKEVNLDYTLSKLSANMLSRLPTSLSPIAFAASFRAEITMQETDERSPLLEHDGASATAEAGSTHHHREDTPPAVEERSNANLALILGSTLVSSMTSNLTSVSLYLPFLTTFPPDWSRLRSHRYDTSTLNTPSLHSLLFQSTLSHQHRLHHRRHNPSPRINDLLLPPHPLLDRLRLPNI